MCQFIGLALHWLDICSDFTHLFCIANRPNNVNALMQLKPNIVTQEITHAAPHTNNFLDSFLHAEPQ